MPAPSAPASAGVVRWDLEGAQVSYTGGGPLLLGVGDIEITGRNTTRLVWERVYRPAQVREMLLRIASGETVAEADTAKDGATAKGRGEARAVGTGGAEGPRAVFVEHVTPRRRAQWLHGQADYLSCLVWDPNERWFATGGGLPQIVIWSAETARPLIKIETSRYFSHNDVTDLAVSPDGRWLVSAIEQADDNAVLVWNTSDGTLHCRLLGHRGPVKFLASDLDGRWFASAGHGIIVWSWDGFQRIREIDNQSTYAAIVAIPGRRWLAANYAQSRRIDVWDIDNGSLVRSRPRPGHSESDREDREAHLSPVDYGGSTALHLLQASPDGRFLAWRDNDTVRVWDLDDPNQPRRMRFHNEDWNSKYQFGIRIFPVLKFVLHSHGRWIAMSLIHQTSVTDETAIGLSGVAMAWSTACGGTVTP